MAGFGKFTLVGEYYGVSIVNVLWYRSADWLPLAGNPFVEMLHAIDSLLGTVKPPYMAGMSSNYTLLRMEGVGYDDAFHIVTPSPAVRTIVEAGGAAAFDTSGAVLTADIKFVLGAQHSITGTIQSKRNRGYIAFGPMGENAVDNYGHFDPGTMTLGIEPIAQALAATVADVGGLTSLIPIRIHHGKTLGLIEWRTYSDIIGYVLPRKPGVRRSRLPEA